MIEIYSDIEQMRLENAQLDGTIIEMQNRLEEIMSKDPHEGDTLEMPADEAFKAFQNDLDIWLEAEYDALFSEIKGNILCYQSILSVCKAKFS